MNNTNIENLICLPNTGWNISKMITNKNIKIYNANDMEMAVRFAKKCTKKGGVCLLSPAASSYGFYKNFKERGDLFKKFVMEDC